MEEPEADDRSNALAAFETLGRFLEVDGWHPYRLETRPAYRVGYAGEGGFSTCYAQIVMEHEILLIYAVAPVRVPGGKLQEAAEYLTRANYGMRIGNFEMDWADGEVRYKTSVDFQGTILEPALIRNALYPAVLTLDHYLPGLLALIYGSRSPAELIAEIESGPM